jgi:hypothetical protein
VVLSPMMEWRIYKKARIARICLADVGDMRYLAIFRVPVTETK